MSEFLRIPRHHYEDPLDRIWIACAEAVGFKVERSQDVYASTDGRGTIFLGTEDILDPDDCLAQMILHELCHALVEGDSGECQPDWGLDNTSGKHTWREHACLRVQAYLTATWGLRDFLAPTTDFRVKFWNELANDPFAVAVDDGRRERSCVAARIALWRATLPRWQSSLHRALEATARVVAVVNGIPEKNDAAHVQGKELLSLYSTANPVPDRHPAGHSFIPTWYGEERCATCAWSVLRGDRMRCRHNLSLGFSAESPGCARWEAKVDLTCETCGACCREAYDAVEVGRREALVKSHPSLIEATGTTTFRLRRTGSRCAALEGGDSKEEAYRCAVYQDRPRTCREFRLGGDNCLEARRKVGLSI